MKKVNLSVAAALFASALWAQQNVLTDRQFWSSKPSVEEVKAAIKAGNNPIEVNNRNFDPIATAILADAPIEDIAYLLSLPEVDVNTKTHEGRTYLIWAAVKQNTEVVKLLLDKGADVTVVDTHGINALNMGANGGIEDQSFYNALIEKGADIKAMNNGGATAILLILQKLEEESMINYFQSKGLDINSKDNEGNGAFMYAAKGGNIKMMDALINRGLDYKDTNKKGENAMLLASIGARRATPELATFEYLASKGIKANVVNNEGETPLILVASKTDDINVFRFFLNAGVDVNAVDQKGNNALIKAAGGASLETMQLLVSKTKDVNHANTLGETALTNAVNGNKAEVVSYLLKAGADVNVQDKEGNSLVYYWATGGTRSRGAAPKTDEAMLSLLSEKGIDFKKAQPNGNTLLHIAVQNENFSLAKKALSLGVDVNAKNKEGNTALLLAALTAKDTKFLEFLVKSGADKSIKSEFDESVFDLAKENEVLSKRHVDINFLK